MSHEQEAKELLEQIGQNRGFGAYDSNVALIESTLTRLVDKARAEAYEDAAFIARDFERSYSVRKMNQKAVALRRTP